MLSEKVHLMMGIVLKNEDANAEIELDARLSKWNFWPLVYFDHHDHRNESS